MSLSYQSLRKHLPQIEEKLGYVFQDKNTLILAFVHRSFTNEHRELTVEHNERLEFLGDAILDLLASEYLYRLLPDCAEGDLSRLRSRLVEASSCLLYIEKLQVENYLLLGRGEKINGSRGRDSILSDLFEAIIGAIYYDGNFAKAKEFFFSHFEKEIEQIVQKPKQNWKAQLQDYVQKKYQQIPVYEVIDILGPDHNKNFSISVQINGVEIAQGRGSSKKEAQQMAAEQALIQLNQK